MAGLVAADQDLPGCGEGVLQYLGLARTHADAVRLVVSHAAHLDHLYLVGCLCIGITDEELVLDGTGIDHLEPYRLTDPKVKASGSNRRSSVMVTVTARGDPPGDAPPAIDAAPEDDDGEQAVSTPTTTASRRIATRRTAGLLFNPNVLKVLPPSIFDGAMGAVKVTAAPRIEGARLGPRPAKTAVQGAEEAGRLVDDGNVHGVRRSNSHRQRLPIERRLLPGLAFVGRAP